MTDLLLIIFIASILVQAYYFISLDWYATKLGADNKFEFSQPISVIVAARNEEENIKSLLLALEKQDYPSFEVIVVNDRSTDQTASVVSQFSQVRLIDINHVPDGWNSKKYALQKGIQEAQHQYLLFTDADCIPSSSSWIRSMACKFTSSDVVLGISPFKPAMGLLGKFIQYEYLLTVWQYTSRAIMGKAYMGVGRNLAYKKSVFMESGGFEGISERMGGDDDLLINRWSGKYRISVESGRDSWVYTTGMGSWTRFFRQKIRHFSAGVKYKWRDQLILGLFMLSYIAFWLSAILLLVLYNQDYLIILGVMVRFVYFVPAVLRAKIRFGSKFGLLNLFILDFLYMLYYITVSFALAITKQVKWK